MEAGEPGDDRGVVAEAAVAVELAEPGEEPLDVVERVGPVRVPRELDLLPGRELGEELAREARGLLLEPAELRLERAIGAGELAQLAHAGHQLDDGLLEGQDVAARRSIAARHQLTVCATGAELLAHHVEDAQRLLFALQRRGASSSTSKRPPRRASVASLTTICPASAMPQRRALVFAVSPMTVYESAFELPM